MPDFVSTFGLVVLAALTTSYQLWWLPVATFAVRATILLIRRLSPGDWLRRTVASAPASVGFMTGLATLLVAAFVQTPWSLKKCSRLPTAKSSGTS